MRGFQEMQNRVPRDGGLLQMMTTGDGDKVATLTPVTEAAHAATVEIAPGSFLQKDEHTIYQVTALWTNARRVSICCFLDSLEQSLEFGRFVYTLFMADEKGVVVLSVKQFTPIDNFMSVPGEFITGFAPQNKLSVKRLLYFLI